MRYKDPKIKKLPYHVTYTQEQRLEELELDKMMKKSKLRNKMIATSLILFTCIFTISMLYFSFKTVPSIVKSFFGVE